LSTYFGLGHAQAVNPRTNNLYRDIERLTTNIAHRSENYRDSTLEVKTEDGLFIGRYYCPKGNRHHEEYHN
jgi:hypothetical protein